jgi:hypothetical protein
MTALVLLHDVAGVAVENAYVASRPCASRLGDVARPSAARPPLENIRSSR